jgi:hypothetical protein
MEQIPVPNSCKNDLRKMAWNTHFFEDGIIEKLPGKVLPQGVCTAMTNNSFLCLLVPVEEKSHYNNGICQELNYFGTVTIFFDRLNKTCTHQLLCP